MIIGFDALWFFWRGGAGASLLVRLWRLLKAPHHIAELLEAAVLDVDGTALAAVIDRDREAQRIGDLFLQSDSVSGLLGRGARASFDVGTHHRFHLADVKPALDDFLRQALRFGVTDQCPRMAGRELSRADAGLHGFG